MSEPIQQVKDLYNRRPYPHYPLLAKPRWQDGYLGSSLFAHALNHNAATIYQAPRKFLSIGSGEILPYIIRQWEPSATRLDCVDLSATSIRRAQFRTALLGRKINFYCNDINFLLQSGLLAGQKFDHVEAYGVLHHITSFKKTLELISSHLTTTGTARIMVYNGVARDWIWQINRAFRNLGLNFESDSDIRIARNLLMELSKISPRLEYRLRQVGLSSLKNNTRFADTFLHPWEARATIHDWYLSFKQFNLEPFALFDRYAELDDLPNPMWACPSSAELTARSSDLRFENNLEVWLRHPSSKTQSRNKITESESTSKIPVRLRLTMPAMNFSKYSETNELSFAAKLTLWQGFLQALHGIHDRAAINLIRNLDTPVAGRLARVGLILPCTAQMANRYDDLLDPLTTEMTPPILPEASNELILPHIKKICSTINQNKSRVESAVQRLYRML